VPGYGKLGWGCVPQDGLDGLEHVVVADLGKEAMEWGGHEEGGWDGRVRQGVFKVISRVPARARCATQKVVESARGGRGCAHVKGAERDGCRAREWRRRDWLEIEQDDILIRGAALLALAARHRCLCSLFLSFSLSCSLSRRFQKSGVFVGARTLGELALGNGAARGTRSLANGRWLSMGRPPPLVERWAGADEMTRCARRVVPG
jgi:hypothetical protein